MLWVHGIAPLLEVLHGDEASGDMGRQAAHSHV